MANPFLGTDAPNIASGWGHAPQLEAPNIAGLVKGILENRQSQQENVQKNVAYAIKQWQEQRESEAYLKAAQAAGLLEGVDPESLSGLGARGASDLAKHILEKKKADAYMAHLLATGGRGRGRGGGGGGSGGPGEVPEDYYGLSVAPGKHAVPTTKVIDGIVNVPTAKGGWKPGPKWMQQGAGGAADATKAMKQQLGNRFSPEDFNPDTVTIEPPKSGASFDTPSTVVTGTGRKMSLPTFQAGVKAMHGGKQAGVGGYDDTAPTTRPDASKGAPVNLPQVGDQRPGPNGTTVEWDGHGWKIVG